MIRTTLPYGQFALAAWLFASACDDSSETSSEPRSSLDAGAEAAADAARNLADAYVAPDSAVARVPDAAAPTRSWVVSDPSAQIAAWKAYTRKAEYDVMTSSVRVPMRDGVALACTLGQPAKGWAVAPGKFPGLVLELTPYAILGSFFSEEAAFFNKRGYNTLVCTLRGIGGSDGTWQNAASSQDRRDAYDLVEWLASQPYSNGRIGQFGESYGAGTTYGGASERPPHLLAIAPQQSPGDLYDDINYPGGIETLRGGTINNWPPIAQLTSYYVVDPNAEFEVWHAHPTYDSFWQERGIASRVGGIDIPILAIGGWVDGYFRSGMMANIEAALANTWMFYGQWSHTYPIDLEACAGVVPCAEQPLPSGVMLAWFDHWLMQLDTPVPAQPTYLSEEGPRGVGKGWRSLDAWLGHDAPTTALQLGSGGSLSASSKIGEAMSFREPGEASESGASLTFSTEPLDRDRVLLGHARLALRATLSATDANFYVQLLDVDPSNQESVVNDGFLKASFRASKTNPTPVTAGQAIDYTIAIRPQHYRFVKGHRLRLRVWGGAKDTVVQPATVTVSVASGTLQLPGWELP